MAEAKKTDKLSAIHHYVPQSYLRRFSFDKKNSKVYAYELDKEPYPTNVKNVGGETGFYNYVDTDGEKTSELEDVFAEIDSNGAEILTKLDSLEPGYINLDEDDRQHLLTYIAFLHVRNARDRRENAEFLGEASLMHYQMLASNKEAFHKNAVEALAETEHEYSENEIEKYRQELLEGGYKINYDPKEQYFMGQSLAKSKELYKVLYLQKRMAICEIEGTRRIVTSDNPVTYYGPEGRKRGMPLGYIHAVFQLPLSPTRMLFLVNPDMELGNFQLNNQHVDHHNFYTYRFAERWIFSDIEAKTIKNMFSEHNSREPTMRISSPFNRANNRKSKS